MHVGVSVCSNWVWQCGVEYEVEGERGDSVDGDFCVHWCECIDTFSA